MINFSIATSWDDSLISQLVNLNTQYKDRKIVEIYGSFKKSITGSGRPAYRLPDVSWEQMVEHTKCAHEHSIKFNYVMNSPDFQKKQNSKLWVEELNKFIAKLDNEVGVDCLTIAHPFLIKLVKEQYPRLKIYLSLITGVDNAEQAKKYEDIGVDIIHLNPHTINRDFKVIEQIVKAVNVPVVLYANIPCLDHCPWRDEHYKFFGYASQNGNKYTTINVDPFVARCSLKYLYDPVQLLKSPFIRPEDIVEYEKVGVTNFKLSDRSESTKFLILTAIAYLRGEYHGNLFSLIFRGGSKFKAGVKSSYPEVNNIKIPVVIDNDRLTEMDFIGQIKELNGQELMNFYRQATEQCVAFEQTAQIKKLKEYLKLVSDERKKLWK